MKVYPVQCRLQAVGNVAECAEILAVFDTLAAAQRFVQRRVGQALNWQKHGGHGALWTADFHYHINLGPEWVQHFAITEHELQLTGPTRTETGERE